MGKEGGEERGRRRTGGKKEENCGHHTSLCVFLVNLTAGKEERCRSLVFSFSHTQCNKSTPANATANIITSISHWVGKKGRQRERQREEDGGIERRGGEKGTTGKR